MPPARNLLAVAGVIVVMLLFTIFNSAESDLPSTLKTEEAANVSEIPDLAPAADVPSFREPVIIPNLAPASEGMKYRCNGTSIKGAHTKALVTFLVDASAGYLECVRVLGMSVRQQALEMGVSMYVMVLKDHTVEVARVLSSAGWTPCTVPLISPPNIDAVFPRFRQQFTKLALFSWTEFERIVYLDGDTLLVGSLANLFQGNYSFGASRDYADGKFRDSFNMGMFSIKPDTKNFHLTLESTSTRTDYQLTMAEQGLLNVLFKDAWTELPVTSNANLAIYLQNRQLWDSFRPTMDVIHYTMKKPFEETLWEDEPMQAWRKVASTQ